MMTTTPTHMVNSSGGPCICPPPSLTSLRQHINQLFSIHSTTDPHSACRYSLESRSELSTIYDELLDLIQLVHPHVYTKLITPLGSPLPSTSSLPIPCHPSLASSIIPPSPPVNSINDITQTSSSSDVSITKDPVPILLNTIQDQRRLVNKSLLDLQVETGLNKVLRHENADLKQKLVVIASATEQEEEALTNKFLLRIEELNQEKAQILDQVEREEEYITNQLQRKLAKLQREKIEMENQLEQEQEAIVNRLQKQLDLVRSTQLGSSNELDNYTNVLPLDSTLPPRHRTSSHASISDKLPNSCVTTPVTPSPTLIDVMRADIIGLKNRIRELETENETRVNQLRVWRDELLILRQRSDIPIDDLFTVPLTPCKSNSSTAITTSIDPTIRSSKSRTLTQ